MTPVLEPVHANPRGHYDYEYSSDKEDWGRFIGINRYN
jgi:quinol monooxygenase YgiN